MHFLANHAIDLNALYLTMSHSSSSNAKTPPPPPVSRCTAGKTTTATLVARESGRDVLELNASDARSKKALNEALGDVTGSQVLSFNNMGRDGDNTKKKSAQGHPPQRRCIIMDEVDGMGAGDRSGMSELIQMIKKSKVPIVRNRHHSICSLALSRLTPLTVHATFISPLLLPL